MESPIFLNWSRWSICPGSCCRKPRGGRWNLRVPRKGRSDGRWVENWVVSSTSGHWFKNASKMKGQQKKNQVNVLIFCYIKNRTSPIRQPRCSNHRLSVLQLERWCTCFLLMRCFQIVCMCFPTAKYMSTRQVGSACRPSAFQIYCDRSFLCPNWLELCVTFLERQNRLSPKGIPRKK